MSGIDYAYRDIHNMAGDPYTRLATAILFQAFQDYAACCRKLKRRSRGNSKSDYCRFVDPRQEMADIRDWLHRKDESGQLVEALLYYLQKRGIRDMY